MYPKVLAGMLFLLLISPAQAVTVNVVPDNSSVGLNDTFSVLVSGVDFPETGGATLGLTFDETVINVTGFSLATGSPFDSITPTTPSASDNVNGEVGFITVLAPLVGALPSGDFDAFVIDFIAVGAGTSAINLIDDGTIKGWTASDFSLISPITYNQGEVTVTSVPLPAAGWLLVSGMGLLGGVVRKTQTESQMR